MASEKQHVLVVGSSPKNIQALLPFARAWANSFKCNILVLGLVAVPSGVSLSAGALEARGLRKAIAPYVRRLGVRVVVRVAHEIWREVQRTASEEACALILLHWQELLPPEWLRTLPGDVAIVKPPFPERGCHILLPIRGGPYAALALRLALAIADTQQGKITVLHATPPTRRGVEYQELVQHLRSLPQVTHWVNVSGDAIEAILHATRQHHLVIMGAIAKPRADDPPIGPTAMQVLNASVIPVIVAKAAPPLLTQEPGRVDFTISVVVDKWFAENTFHAREFRDLAHLVKLKEQQGLTISLGLPALNEEKTIGKIIRTIRAQLMRRYPLLDEIVVIDSNSTDRTVEIAQELGVPVYRHSEILPMYGTNVGKGEALWKSLFVLKGDLVAWIDTDIVNIHPRFVQGILGPLIRDPHLFFIKGFYQRPLRVGRKYQARGGGRVTELVARPLLNLFYPELSGFVQPLAGEYAGRREAFESVPFFIGYGVETGLLIDLWARFGLKSMGQVDLEERVHRNQSLMALSKMAFEIIQVAMQRVGASRQVELLNELNQSMKLIRQARDEFQLDVVEIRAHERPPMITLPEYRQVRGID